jgi:hypothetical protein
LEAEPPKGQNTKLVRHDGTTNKMDVSKVTGPPRWTLQEDNVLRAFPVYVPRPEYPTHSLEAMGPGRTRGATVVV